MERVIRVETITQTSISVALARFDQVVVDIESCVRNEAQRGTILTLWPAQGDEGTCAACDFRHFCPAPASARSSGTNYSPPAPAAP